MKIKVRDMNYDDVMSMSPKRREKPTKQSTFFRKVLSFLSGFELRKVGFSFDEIGMDQLPSDQPCLILMNHSSFIDLEIVAKVFSKRPYHIVTTRDGFIGKDALLRRLGCVPTEKFVVDVGLLRDMKRIVSDLGESIVLYPEASYSFDGTATPLPSSVGKFIKMLGVPVVMVTTQGAFLRDPLYNCLQKRDVTVSATVRYLLSPDDAASLSADDINAILKEQFSFDHFRHQFESGIVVDEPFRADGLHRVLYKCPKCDEEGSLFGKGTAITCSSCGDAHELTELGKLSNVHGHGEFEFVSDWYSWQRACVRDEIASGDYEMTEEVDILMLVDSKSMYRVGSGVLTHDVSGFSLKGCDGKLDYHQAPEQSYSLYADYYWYEIGDMIAIGTSKCRYYCFPKAQDKAIVAKARLAAEEMFAIKASANASSNDSRMRS